MAINNVIDSVKAIKESVSKVQKFPAIIEEIGNKDKPGQVRMRVAGVHTSDKSKLPTKKLPWSKVINEVGAGGGIGESINLAIGQWVEVEAEHEGLSSWRILQNIPAIGELTEDLINAYGSVAKGSKKRWLTQDIIPRIGSGNRKKLKGTTYPLINASACNSSASGAIPPCNKPSTCPAPEEGDPHDIVCYDVCWCRRMDKVVGKDGANLGNFAEAIIVDGYPPSCDDVKIELMPHWEDKNNDGTAEEYPPGDIVGYDKDGEILHATIEDGQLFIPRMAVKKNYVGINIPAVVSENLPEIVEPKDIVKTITYRVTDLDHPTNYKEAKISVRLVYNIDDAFDTYSDVSPLDPDYEGYPDGEYQEPKGQQRCGDCIQPSGLELEEWDICPDPRQGTRGPQARGLFDWTDSVPMPDMPTLFTMEEELSTAHNTMPDECKVWQSPLNFITTRKDYTEGNVTYDIAHCYEENNSEAVSRMVMGPTGKMTLRSADSMDIINKMNFKHQVRNTHEINAKTSMTSSTPMWNVNADATASIFAPAINLVGVTNFIGSVTYTSKSAKAPRGCVPAGGCGVVANCCGSFGCTGNINCNANMSCGGNLGCDGDLECDGDSECGGNSTVGGTATIEGVTTINNDLHINGKIYCNGVELSTMMNP